MVLPVTELCNASLGTVGTPLSSNGLQYSLCISGGGDAAWCLFRDGLVRVPAIFAQKFVLFCTRYLMIWPVMLVLGLGLESLHH